MSRRAIQIVDLGFGDSGKGTMVDYLVRRHGIDLVIRFNGGPQAGHNVVLPDGRHHTFAQFGSGSFVPGVRTFLSRFMLIEPYALLNEAAHLSEIGVPDALERTSIDERCQVITPPQQIANRIRERARGAAAHGTCGLGIGECASDSLQRPELSMIAADLSHPNRLRKKLTEILEYKRNEMMPFLSIATASELEVLDCTEWIDVAIDTYGHVVRRGSIISEDRAAGMIRETDSMIFEGAQGVLLDERYGFHPHTTWSTTTFANADTLLAESEADVRPQRIGVTRTYQTRHGIGPFPTADEALSRTLAEPHNSDQGMQGRFRRGALDLVLLRYALEVCRSIDGLAITHLDALSRLPSCVCTAYRIGNEKLAAIPLNPDATIRDSERFAQKLSAVHPVYSSTNIGNADTFIEELQRRCEASVSHRSFGPTFLDKK